MAGNYKEFEWIDWIKKSINVYDHLSDRESQLLFNARFSFMKNRSLREWSRVVDTFYDDWRYDSKLDEHDGIVVWGAKTESDLDYWFLSSWGMSLLAYCDKNHGGKLNGVDIISPKEAAKKYPNAVYVVGSHQRSSEIVAEMKGLGLSEEQIVCPPYKLIRAERGWQYFDFFDPQDEEIFVDAGTYTGGTIADFVKWTDGNYSKVFGMEAMPDIYSKAYERFKDEPRISISNAAAWNKQELLMFNENDSASSQSDCGTIEVKGMDIDSLVGESKVTFIKMDIEGAELKALEGSRNTILRCSPRLAICVYHHLMDFVDLASYILDLNPNYKLAFRQYMSHDGETVLYAWI